MKVRKVYYKCLCHEEMIIAVSITELDDLNMKEFYNARKKIDKVSFCA